jgi:MYXO-CTERM domain-containing protein
MNIEAGAPPGRSMLSGVFFGLGVAAFVDETVFHQLLHWHHFYDKSTPAAGLVSDGIFHAFGFFCAVGALFLLADLRRRQVFDRRRWWGGLLAGAGAFQLYDGTVQHKLLHLHQIRYHVDLAPYDWTWNVIAVVMLAAGAGLLWRRRRQTA